VAVTAALGPLLAAAALPVIPTVFGTEFHAAVLPACVLLAGLCVEGAAAVSSAYLCGTGRPGANSLGMLAGVTVTVALDALLIPRSGALGAAIASTAAYLVTTSLLTGMSLRRRAEQRS
jgi:O-antigen/teichoic acid export membrane protein